MGCGRLAAGRAAGGVPVIPSTPDARRCVRERAVVGDFCCGRRLLLWSATFVVVGDFVVSGVWHACGMRYWRCWRGRERRFCRAAPAAPLSRPLRAVSNEELGVLARGICVQVVV
ncbi:unnamed protein product [Chondrus crispus]|uniref:Uncharacterized protein n=1 Tax=Chondrus crispus TaxID=2769 RepID=R7Q5L9_CHOCR|nr:unnamed protein product [Chondrus crispus]CDF33128.1 unnamed protein product [Chondrus crispus]|eukprot:XP_005712931.1 unnamed protein product [Chondrus crispus]